MVSPPHDFEQKESRKTADARARAAAGSLRYRRAHKGKINARRREKYWTDPEFRKREKGRARRISDDAYDLLFARQGGVCAIGKHRSGRRLHADHCHATGKLRGLLCSNCNTGLGFYHDDPDRLLAAAAYLLASRCDLGTADAGAAAAEVAEQLRRRLEVHLRAAFRMAPRGVGWDGNSAGEGEDRSRCALLRALFEKMKAILRWRAAAGAPNDASNVPPLLASSPQRSPRAS